MQLAPSSQYSKSRLQVLEFWTVLLLPWLLDFLSGKSVFISVFGALMWGVAVALSAARAKTRDFRFRKMLGVALGATSVIWLGYWLYLLIETASGHMAPTGVGMNEASHILVIAHAGLLAAGAGMVLVVFLVSSIWIVQNELLRRPSWERRDSTFRLPSLEALARVTMGALDLSFISWGLGFFLAFLNALITWRGHNVTGEVTWSWLTDTKVIAVAWLWVLLVFGFQLGHFLQPSSRWLFRFYWLISFIFALCFWFLFVIGSDSKFHESIGWFSR